MGYKILGKGVSKIGYGLMSLTWWGAEGLPEETKIACMKAALDAGSNSWNGGEFYGPALDHDNSLTLLKRYFEIYPEDAEKVSINIKSGANLSGGLSVDNSPEYTRRGIENCLKLLGPRGKIDLYEMPRRVTKDEYLESLRVIDGYVKEGKIGGVALSEINANTIRQAVQVVKVSAVEIELSLFHTEPLTNGIIEACAEFGIPIFAYCPLGRGFLTGKITKPEDLSAQVISMRPRLQGDNFAANLKLVEKVKEWAAKKGCTPGQFSINWLATLSKRSGMPHIIPIPGSKSVDRVVENAKEVELTDEDMDEVDAFLKEFTIVGDRLAGAPTLLYDKTDTPHI